MILDRNFVDEIRISHYPVEFFEAIKLCWLRVFSSVTRFIKRMFDGWLSAVFIIIIQDVKEHSVTKHVYEKMMTKVRINIILIIFFVIRITAMVKLNFNVQKKFMVSFVAVSFRSYYYSRFSCVVDSIKYKLTVSLLYVERNLKFHQ